MAGQISTLKVCGCFQKDLNIFFLKSKKENNTKNFLFLSLIADTTYTHNHRDAFDGVISAAN